MRRAPLLALVVAIVLASCSSSPGIDVTVAGVGASTTPVSQTQRTACSASVGDFFPQTIPLSEVRTTAPVALHFRSASYVSEIRGWIYDDVDGRPSGEPIEEFVVRGSEGQFISRSMKVGGTYNVLVNAAWSFVVSGGEESRAFRVRIAAV